jgi:hypothetical protein
MAASRLVASSTSPHFVTGTGELWAWNGGSLCHFDYLAGAEVPNYAE